MLVQELQRYNILLRKLSAQLAQLESGMKGLSVITQELESIQKSLEQNLVPVQWGDSYFSLKPLASWIADLKERYLFFTSWATKGSPHHFWIGAFTYPTGFTTSLLQKFSRKAQAAIDTLSFEFQMLNTPAHAIADFPKDGAYISGLFLEGAKWNFDKHCLEEPDIMELQCDMPVVYFRPRANYRPPSGTYDCPVYYYPERQGTISKSSYMMKIDLKYGDHGSEFWIKRGAALLMSSAS